MKIALIGATGNAGSRILAELSRRGYQAGVARYPETVSALSGVTPLEADAGDAVALANEIEKPAHSRQRFTVGY